ncbi:MAG: 30S ribosomal protein S1 [Deltaproteobacteria bacterium]|nr:30S ribosomal protein S1 [Deltaproteobacteria bacterium]
MDGLEKNSDTEQKDIPGPGSENEEAPLADATASEPASSQALQGADTEQSQVAEAGGEETQDADQTTEKKQEDFMEMYEESIRRVQEGEVVQGKIIQIDKEFVLVDIGYKSEGQVPIEEFMKPDGTIDARVGDTVDVMVDRWEDEDGAVRVSKEKASRIKVWDDIKKAYEGDGVIQGTITSRIKGGLSVDIGLPAFLPGSQVDLRPVRNLDDLVGQTFDFKVLKYNRKRSNVVLSRRVILEKEREAKRAETLATIHVGKVIEGIVKNITEYGVFVDLGGIDGLLHITDMSWGRVNYPSEMFSVGDKITVKVLNLDLERERVSLGLKQLVPDPWTTAEEKYPIGSHVMGKVVSLTDYGAFVELEKGVEGLIHVSEMSWTRKVRHPSKVVSVGETVEAVVLNISAENRRISLGMKQVVPNPWDVIAEKYPVGTTIEGKIKNITDFGLFIGIDEGIDGLVHISDISWTRRIKHPSELYKKGQEVQAIVLNIDKENERFSLGIKQLQRDPWEAVPERYQVGSKITGTVTNVTDFGVFVELEEGIEGLVHISEVSDEKLKTLLGKFEVGDVVSAKVLNINPKDRRIGLSIKQLEIDEEHSLVSDYLSSYDGPTSSLGELLKENLKERAASGEASAGGEPEADKALEDAPESVPEPETQSEQAMTDTTSAGAQPEESPSLSPQEDHESEATQEALAEAAEGETETQEPREIEAKDDSAESAAQDADESVASAGESPGTEQPKAL